MQFPKLPFTYNTARKATAFMLQRESPLHMSLVGKAPAYAGERQGRRTCFSLCDPSSGVHRDH